MMQKTQVEESMLNEVDLEFSLVETILWESCCGFWLLPEHLARLKASAAHFFLEYNETNLVEQLNKSVEGLSRAPHLIRTQIDTKGEITLLAEASDENRRPVTATLAKESIDTENEFIYHKTTYRQMYTRAMEGMSDYDEVLLWNSKGEVTESCTSNILFEIEEQLYTPPLSCGLLPGTLRANLLADGSIKERPILTDQLAECDNIYLINSAIGWRPVEYTP